jgi:hypothetical protein
MKSKWKRRALWLVDAVGAVVLLGVGLFALNGLVLADDTFDHRPVVCRFKVK